MRRVKLGVIGCGVIGASHVECAAGSPDIELLAVADLRREVAAELAKKHNVPRVYGPAEELLADRDVEGVVLAMPTCHRYDLALKAFAAGKHVLTEKPVAMSAAQVLRLIEARGDRVAGCCSSRYGFLATAQLAADAVAAGKLGDIRVLHCRAIIGAGPAPPPEKPPPDWRLKKHLNGGGILVNWGCYDLDYLFHICGWNFVPQTVLAQTWQVAPHLAARAAPGSAAEPHVVALARCQGGTVIHYERAEMATTTTTNTWSIVGSKGSLRLEMSIKPEKRISLDYADDEGVHTQTLFEGTEDIQPVYAGPVVDFAAAIREGRQPRTSLERALVLQKLTDAIYASAATGQAVAVG